MKRHRLQIVGESGSGLLSLTAIVSKALRRCGYFVVADREFPSLIKGGQSRVIINFDDEPLHSLSPVADIMVAIDKKSLIKFIPDIKKNGVLVHGYERLMGVQRYLDEFTQKGGHVLHMPARTTVEELGGSPLMANMVLLGLVWKAMGLAFAPLEAEITKKFAKKPKLLALDLKIVKYAYEKAEVRYPVPEIMPEDRPKEALYIDGAHALALGAVKAGVRAYIGYPMSPSTGVLKHMAVLADEYELVFKQAEDEITAAQMVIGANYAGTRALTATSGGGFDLMTETVSLSGITETPLVIIVAQRPGPGTGLPTWTAQGDLDLAIKGGHGEFTRCVLACSTPDECFVQIQQALNISEVFQIPVVVLTDKWTQESFHTVFKDDFQEVSIERGLVEDEKALQDLKSSDRFAFTESGVSKRWIPTKSDAFYFANGDEHNPDGTLTEDAVPAAKMIEKRIRKQEALAAYMPEPELLGDKNAQTTIISWGSTKCVILDVLLELKKQSKSVNVLHYSFVHPLKTEILQKLVEQGNEFLLLEGNATGQFAEKIKPHLKCGFKDVFLKWNGRPFYVEEVLEWISRFV